MATWFETSAMFRTHAGATPVGDFVVSSDLMLSSVLYLKLTTGGEETTH